MEHSYDFLSVIDDKNKGALLARLTGFIASPPVLVVNTTRFSLRLVTDDQVQHQGFIIRYWVDAAPVAVPEQPYWMPGGGAGTGGASTWLCDTWMVVHGANYFQDSTAGTYSYVRLACNACCALFITALTFVTWWNGSGQ